MNQPIFGTEMIMLTFILGVIQILVLFVHFGVILTKPYSKANWRFLILIIAFIFYNACSGLFPDKTISINLVVQNILAFGSGIILASYYFYFLVTEIELEQSRFFSFPFLLSVLSGSFIITYLLPYLITRDFLIAKKVFIVIPVIVAIYYCFNTILGIVQKSNSQQKGNPYKRLFVVGNLGITFMATMPIVVAFGDFQLINNGLVNVSFFLVLFAFYSLLNTQARLDQSMGNSLLNEQNKINVSELNLTPRELEVTSFILNGLNYTEIGDRMFISNKTVSKHASNIFKKVNCSDRNEFIDKFVILTESLEAQS